MTKELQNTKKLTEDTKEEHEKSKTVTDILEEIVKLDNEYIMNWSFGLDIKIILKTFLVVIARKGSV